MDDGQAGVASSSGAAGQPGLQVPSAAGQPEQGQQEQGQQQHSQQLTPAIPGARNYGYPDDFMMYAFKVEPCTRTDKHPRGSCPYAHPGDVARRRHPSRYEALLCPEVRAKKVCPRVDECLCSHSAFEFWLHPSRYRTSMCEKGARCSRPVCFFAHTAEELRPLPAGLKPAEPKEAAAGTSSSSSRRGGGSSSTGTGMWQAPGGGVLGQMYPACLPAGLSGGLRYVQQQAAQPQQQAVLQPGMQLVPAAAAGAAGSGGYSPGGYMPVQMQAAVDGSMVQQPAMQYGQAPGHFYAPAAVAEQPHMQRGSGPGLVMPPGPQQQQYVLQPAAVQQQAQLPEMMQQSQGLLVSSAPMTPQHQQQQYAHFGPTAAAAPTGQWQHGGTHQHQGHGQQQQQQQQMVMLMQPSAGPQAQQVPYMMQQPQMMYMQGSTEHASWSQGSQQQQMHQQQHQQYMYGAGYSPAAAGAGSSSSGYQRAYGHHAHVPQYPQAHHQHSGSGLHSSGGPRMLPHSATPASVGMHVPIAAAGAQPPPPPGSTGSAGLVLGAPLLHQGSQQLAAPAAAAAVAIDAGSLSAAGQHVNLMHQAGGVMAAGETSAGAVGHVLTGNAALGLNVPGGGVQGQQADRSGWYNTLSIV